MLTLQPGKLVFSKPKSNGAAYQRGPVTRKQTSLLRVVCSGWC